MLEEKAGLPCDETSSQVAAAGLLAVMDFGTIAAGARATVPVWSETAGAGFARRPSFFVGYSGLLTTGLSPPSRGREIAPAYAVAHSPLRITGTRLPSGLMPSMSILSEPIIQSM